MKFLLLGLLGLIPSAFAIDPIVIKGAKFFNTRTKEQFYIKGVAYQPGGEGKGDPLSKPDRCKRDIQLFKELGVNVIRVYEAFPNEDHDECMKLLSDAGIYLILDLSNPKESINREDPKYTVELLDAYIKKAQAFLGYDNTLAFFAGNEVNNDVSNTDANPFVKGVLRDIKAFLKKAPRYIPVGYANNDDEKTILNIQEYFNCGSEEDRADFFGYNIYSWCGKSDMKTSRYDQKTTAFKDYGIPVFFSEYGCNSPRPRQFGDVQALYSKPMSDVFSGGLVYEFTEEANAYGLIKLDGEKATKLKDFDTYKTELAKVKPQGVKMDSYNPSSKPLSCPAQSKNWKASEQLPPTPSKDACKCMTESLSCVVSNTFDMKTKKDEISKLFAYLCGEGNGDCQSLKSDGGVGEYGEWSMCDVKSQLSWALNSVYTKSKKPEACTANGVGQVVSPKGKLDGCLSKKPDLTPKAGSGKDSAGSGSSEGSKHAIMLSLVLPIALFSILF